MRDDVTCTKIAQAVRKEMAEVGPLYDVFSEECAARITRLARRLGAWTRDDNRYMGWQVTTLWRLKSTLYRYAMAEAEYRPSIEAEVEEFCAELCLD